VAPPLVALVVTHPCVCVYARVRACVRACACVLAFVCASVRDGVNWCSSNTLLRLAAGIASCRPESWDVSQATGLSKMHGCYNAIGLWFLTGIAGIVVDASDEYGAHIPYR
jgi:hypothetical protein